MSFWTRIKTWFGGGQARPKLAPGRWIEGGKTSWRGFLALAPWKWPRRRYRLYLPRGWSRWTRAPLIALCHGCRQTPQEFAQGTRIAELADRLGALVLMPDQKDSANPFRCWNWFDRATAKGHGEAAIVAAMIRSVRRWKRADPARIVVAGISAGGALAAVLGVRYPALVRGAVVHSGLACGAASSAFTAISVMRRGPDTDIAQIGREARTDAKDEFRVPLLAIQGMGDDVVAPRNAAALARQYLALNGIEVPAGAESSLPEPDVDRRDTSNLLRPARIREWRQGTSVIVRLIEIDGLGHAWSGGDATLPFNDAAPPEATAMLGDWLISLAA
jgi:poly(hydroxyalkanoate) depolymerase family esterase